MAADTCIWLTGLPGAGKSSLARALCAELSARGERCVVLDADVIRQGLNVDLGFTRADRLENARRLAEVARLFVAQGLLPVVAAISPYVEDRVLARRVLQPFGLLEVHVATPVEVCMARDPKGLYAKARAGEISGLAGFDVPYEPGTPQLGIRTDLEPLAQSVSTIIAALPVRLPAG